MRILLITALFILGFAMNAYPMELVFFPTERFTNNAHTALLRAPAIDVLYTYSTPDKRQYMSYNFGARFGLLSADFGDDLQAELGGGGGVFTRFELFTHSFDFIHADFLGVGTASVRYKKLVLETSLYHVSSHVGDDYIRNRHEGRAPWQREEVFRNVGFEAIKQYAGYRFSPLFETSLGFEYKPGRRPEGLIFYRASFFAGLRLDFLSIGVPVFFECEAELYDFKREPNFGARLGVYLSCLFNTVFMGRDPGGREQHEFSIWYYYGNSKLGFFYKKRESLILAGPTYRF